MNLFFVLYTLYNIRWLLFYCPYTLESKRIVMSRGVNITAGGAAREQSLCGGQLSCGNPFQAQPSFCSGTEVLEVLGSPCITAQQLDVDFFPNLPA